MVQEINPTPILDRVSAMTTTEGPSDEKRKKVGNYIILRTIGEGSFAKVRLGIHLITEMKVAVKVINKREVFQRNYLRANLRREASMMQRMSHSNIVQLHEVMETENSYYIVMDLVEGNEFVKYLTRKRQLDEHETRKYIRQIVSAVDHMHRAHVIHRDIKLQNFMLNQHNDIIIIDFGLSNCLDEKGFLTTQCGSPAYAAPEIFAHQEYGPAVDIWSIGVNMYAMLLGKLPFKVEHRSRNLAKLHACILKGCEIPNTLSRECQDLLSRLLEPSPTKRITMPEILRHPFLTYQSGPIDVFAYKPHADAKDINKTIVRYLAFKHGYSEHEIEDAVLHRKPIAARALYSLVERRLKEGLGWPDRTYNHSVVTMSSVAHTEIPADLLALDKLDRQEPLLPGRRTQCPAGSSLSNPNSRLSREKSNYAFDEQVPFRAQNGSTAHSQDALHEITGNARGTSKKFFQDLAARKNSATVAANPHEMNEDPQASRRFLPNSNSLAPVKASLTNQRANVVLLQQQQQQQQQATQKVKPRSLPNSTLDHANPNGFHVPNDSSPSRTSKATSRLAHGTDASKRTPSHSPVRYNQPTPSVTIKAIGLFLKNSALQSRVSSCSSRSSKSTGANVIDASVPSPPLKHYPSVVHSNPARTTMINYHSQGHLPTSTATRQTFLHPTSVSPHRLTPSKVQHTSTSNGHG